MKICANCGTSVPDDAAFCNNCGSAMTESPASENNSTPAAPSADTNAAPSQPAPAPAPAPGPAPQPGFQQQPYGQAPYQQPQYQQPYVAFDPKDHTSEFDPQDIADNKLFAILPYLFSCIAGIIVGIYVKDSEFVKFHIKNSIRIDVTAFLLLLVCIIPFIGWVVAIIGVVVLVVIDIIALVWAFQGKAKELPIISSIGFLK
ncbi:MAG: zinc-ribbon domain-containing protein [Butyrivibrio sp.]|nr:zinc-ribbon domain-containing protein [Butyrivibrio sp.]MBR1641773.1 zinc-ribbon domain-containing protein [Butyrivibrio sp.]